MVVVAAGSGAMPESALNTQTGTMESTGGTMASRAKGRADVYAFVSPEHPDKVVLVGNWVPGEEPSSGPNYFRPSLCRALGHTAESQRTQSIAEKGL